MPECWAQCAHLILHKQSLVQQAAHELIAGQGEHLRQAGGTDWLQRWKKAASAEHWYSRLKWLHMNESKPLIYYNPIVGVSTGMAAALFLCLPLISPAIMGWAHGVLVATLTSVSLGEFPLERLFSQPLSPLGFGPCGWCFPASGWGLPQWCGGDMMKLLHWQTSGTALEDNLELSKIKPLRMWLFLPVFSYKNLFCRSLVCVSLWGWGCWSF